MPAHLQMLLMATQCLCRILVLPCQFSSFMIWQTESSKQKLILSFNRICDLKVGALLLEVLQRQTLYV